MLSILIFKCNQKLRLSLLSHSSQAERLHHISVQIHGVLDTTAHADKVIEDTGGLALFLGDTSMGHAGRHLTQTLNTSKTLGEGEDLSVLAEIVSSLLAALNAEAEHTTAHTLTVLLEGNSAVGVGVNAGVVDGDDVGRGFKGIGNDSGVLGRLAGAKVQGLQTAVSEPAVECGGDGADGVLKEAEALLEGLGIEGSNAHQDILSSS